MSKTVALAAAILAIASAMPAFATGELDAIITPSDKARLEKYDEAFITRTALHPRLLTPMRVIDLCFFVAEHDDHHLARIWELLQL